MRFLHNWKAVNYSRQRLVSSQGSTVDRNISTCFFSLAGWLAALVATSDSEQCIISFKVIISNVQFTMMLVRASRGWIRRETKLVPLSHSAISFVGQLGSRGVCHGVPLQRSQRRLWRSFLPGRQHYHSMPVWSHAGLWSLEDQRRGP